MKNKNILGLTTSAFITYNQSIKTQMVMGAVSSGGIISIDGSGNVNTFLDNPWSVSSTTLINGALLQPFGGALGNALGIGQFKNNLFINSASGGLQYGIEGTRKFH